MATPGYPLGEAPPTMSTPQPRSWWPGYLIAALLLVAGIVAGFVFGGQVGQFMLAGSQVIPFAILAVLAYLGVRYDWVRILSYLWLVFVLVSLASVAVLLVATAQAVSLLGDGMAPPDPNAVVGAIFSPTVVLTFLWTVAGLLVAAVLMIPAVRRGVARKLPIDPASSVHAAALSLVGGSIIICFGQLIATAGSPVLLQMIENLPDAAEASAPEGQDMLLTVYAFAWTVPSALLAGGWPMARSFRAVLQRLGLVVPSWRQVVAALVLAVALVGLATMVGNAITWLFTTMGWTTTDTAAFDQLLGSLISPLGAVIIGVTAGVGEEMVVRGVLQPRLGILVSNLFFTGLHAFQYGFDGLLTVFFVGLVLGVVRARSNTTTAAIVHGVYNFILVMFAALQGS